MNKNFAAALFAGTIILGAMRPVFAEQGPIISGLPDVQIGDLEDSVDVDNFLFEFPNAYNFSDYVDDANTSDSLLHWYYGESGTEGEPRYAVNGRPALYQGDEAMAAGEEDDHLLVKNQPPQSEFRINAYGADAVNFRDIILSPADATAPFDEPDDQQTSDAAEGRMLRFYVVDPNGNVDHRDFMTTTAVGGNDELFDSDGFRDVVTDSSFTEWLSSGIQSAEVSTSNEEGLQVHVAPAQARYRIYGYRNPNLMPYDAVGKSKFVRGKFYVHTDVPFTHEVNKVPGFRVRVTNEDAVYASTHYEYAQTGYSAATYEPYYGTINNPEAELRAGQWIRPSANPAIPSLYRIDFDPVDVPASVGSNIGATFESYTATDTADGSLILSEVVLSTYDALKESDGELVFEFNRTRAGEPSAGGSKMFISGGFNHEADMRPGRLQDLDIPVAGEQPGTGYVSGEPQGDNFSEGYLMDSNTVPSDVFGIGIMNVMSTDNADMLRVSPGKLYRTKFYATSMVPTQTDDEDEKVQSVIRFRFQTAANTISHMLEIVSCSLTVKGTTADSIAAQALPGIGSQNPDTQAELDMEGEDGGWYTVVAPSPLDPEGIRKDHDNKFYLFGDEPGPGDPADSMRDAHVGIDVITLPRGLKVQSNFRVPFARPNRAHVRIGALEVYEHPALDDGGYQYEPPVEEPVIEEPEEI